MPTGTKIRIRPEQGTMLFQPITGSSDIQLYLTTGATSGGTKGVMVFSGSTGDLFAIVDSFDGSLMAVSGEDGIPIMEVFDNDTIVMGEFGSNALVVSGTSVIIGTTPTSGASTQVLTRNETTGKIEYTASSGFTGGGTPAGSDTEIQFNNNGAFSGDSAFTFSGSTQSLTLGTRTGNSGLNSFSQGSGNIASGDYSHAEGKSTQAIGARSHAEGSYARACGYGSHAESGSFAIGDYSHSEALSRAYGANSHAQGGGRTYGEFSHAQGTNTRAYGDASFAGGKGLLPQSIRVSGNTSFIHSRNDVSQTVGHGANANDSAILGGLNHNIETGNTGATIIGGNSIKLTGTTYVDTTAVGNLAIMSTPISGSSDQVLIRNTSTGVVEYTHSSGFTGGGVTGADNGLSLSGGSTIILGGTLTDDTIVNMNSNSITFGSRKASVYGANTMTVGIFNTATGNTSAAFGYYSYAYGAGSFVKGRFSIAQGGYSHAEGNSTKAYSTYSHAEGVISDACGYGSHAEGGGTCTFGKYSHSEGRNTIAVGDYSHSQGKETCASGTSSQTGGEGLNTKEVLTTGRASFNHSRNTASQTAGHGALADNSAILGGQDHNIEIGNTNATIIGGNAIKLTGTTYTGATAVDKLAIMSTPTSGASSQVLTRNITTGIVEYTHSSGFTGGGVTGAANGTCLNGTTVELGGTLTKNTCIDTGFYGISFGNSNAYATGYNSFAAGETARAYGESAMALGYYTRACANASLATGWFTKAYGINSTAQGESSEAHGSRSHAINTSFAYGNDSFSQGATTHASGCTSFAGGKGQTSGRQIIAKGYASFVHSYNTVSQTAGHGALADNSAILGGQDHNIESGNTGAAIIGGNTIKLTGTSYIDTTAVGKLALISGLTEGYSNEVLSRNASTGIVEYTNLTSTTGLSDGSTITFDFQSKPFGVKTLTTTNTSITVNLENILAGANQFLSVNKNTASTVTLTLSGDSLTFYGYNDADLNTTPDIVLSGATGDIFDISFLARTATEIGVSVGYKGN